MNKWKFCNVFLKFKFVFFFLKFKDHKFYKFNFYTFEVPLKFKFIKSVTKLTSNPFIIHKTFFWFYFNSTSDSLNKKELLSTAHAEKRLSIMKEEDENGSDEKKISSQNISQV